MNTSASAVEAGLGLVVSVGDEEVVDLDLPAASLGGLVIVNGLFAVNSIHEVLTHTTNGHIAWCGVFVDLQANSLLGNNPICLQFSDE